MAIGNPLSKTGARQGAPQADRPDAEKSAEESAGEDARGRVETDAEKDARKRAIKGATVDVRRPGSIEAALRRSLKAAVGGDWLAAETWLERVVEADSADLDAYFALARLYREQGAIGRAIRMHQNLLLRGDLDRTQRLDALLELARDFDSGGYSERAMAGYEEVLDAKPKHVEALRRLVALLHEQREYPRALALVKRLRRLDRTTADREEEALWLAQAAAQHAEGNNDGARASLGRCLRRSKSCGEAWALLGDLEAERGKDSRALAAWRRGVTADASVGSSLYPKIAASYAAKSKGADYEKFLRGLLEARPTDSAARVAHARAIASRGATGEAIEELSRAIEVDPGDAALRLEIGRQLLDSAQETEALKAYAGLLEALERGELVSAPSATTAAPGAESKAGAST